MYSTSYSPTYGFSMSGATQPDWPQTVELGAPLLENPFATEQTAPTALSPPATPYPTAYGSPDCHGHLVVPQLCTTVPFLAPPSCERARGHIRLQETQSMSDSMHRQLSTGLVATSESTGPRAGSCSSLSVHAGQILPPTHDPPAVTHSGISAGRRCPIRSPALTGSADGADRQASCPNGRESEHGPIRHSSSHRMTRDLDLQHPRRRASIDTARQHQSEGVRDFSERRRQVQEQSSPGLRPPSFVFINFSPADGKELMGAVRRANGSAPDP